jgi:hypothetical protein
MTTGEKSKLSQEIEDISKNFENKPLTENFKLLKEDLDINSISTPNHYLKTIDKLQEILRETRLLFIYSVLNRVCKEEGKLYNFETPYQAAMKYSGVMKKEGSFYILDEDGDYSGIFTSEAFSQFIDDSYWELYE